MARRCTIPGHNIRRSNSDVYVRCHARGLPRPVSPPFLGARGRRARRGYPGGDAGPRSPRLRGRAGRARPPRAEQRPPHHPDDVEPLRRRRRDAGEGVDRVLPAALSERHDQAVDLSLRPALPEAPGGGADRVGAGHRCHAPELHQPVLRRWPTGPLPGVAFPSESDASRIRHAGPVVPRRQDVRVPGRDPSWGASTTTAPSGSPPASARARRTIRRHGTTSVAWHST